MELKNNEGKSIEIHLKEKWNVAFKKLPILFGFLYLLCFVFIVVSIVLIIQSGGEAREFVLLILSLLLFLLFSIPTIPRLIKPAEYLVRIENDTLSIHRNGKEKLSITSQKTVKIIVNRPRKYLAGVGIFEKMPEGFSKGIGYSINFSYIPDDETQEFLKLLVAFYGEQRLKELVFFSRY